MEGWLCGEIYMIEQRRIGKRQERGEGMCREEKDDLKEKGKCRNREIYCVMRREHIKMKVKDLEKEKQVSNTEWSI